MITHYREWFTAEDSVYKTTVPNYIQSDPIQENNAWTDNSGTPTPRETEDHHKEAEDL